LLAVSKLENHENSVTHWGKLLLLHHSALGFPMSDTSKNRGVPSSILAFMKILVPLEVVDELN
jgi:hypothetical protein